MANNAIYYMDDLGKNSEVREIPAELADKAAKAREFLIESIAESDDELTMLYLEGQELSLEELKRGLRKATIANKLVPVLCGSALKNKGVQRMLDAVVHYLPAPIDVPPIKAVRPGYDPDAEDAEFVDRPHSENAPFAGLVFKIMADPFVGKLAYFRVYSGKLESGTYVMNTTKNRKERVGRLLQMHANHREEIKEVYAGDIAAMVGPKETFTGDTICTADDPVVLENIKFPEPVISVAIEPKTKADQDKMGLALSRLAEEDPNVKAVIRQQMFVLVFSPPNFNGCIGIRLKKLDEDGLSKNQPTTQVKEFRDQLTLPAVEADYHLEAGYVVDRFGSALTSVDLVCPSGDGIYWKAEIVPNGANQNVANMFPQEATQVMKEVRVSKNADKQVGDSNANNGTS